MFVDPSPNSSGVSLVKFGSEYVLRRSASLESKEFGERAGSRTQNLLIFDQKRQTNGFNGFPTIFVVTSRQN